MLSLVGVHGVEAADKLDRAVLPVPEPKHPPNKELDARKAKAPPQFEVKGAGGCAQRGDRAARRLRLRPGEHLRRRDRDADPGPAGAGGLRYNQFHTTALCSPTRMALLAGRNHHSANTGSVMEISTAFPGNRGRRPNSAAPLAEMLRLNGYSTAAFGKYHETAPWEVSVSGPFDRWPTRSGFDKFYGFIGGETNQAIRWVRYQRALAPDRPLEQDKWELYHVTEDFSQADDLAAANPRKLKELRALFRKEAAKYNVLPLDDRKMERFDPRLAGRHPEFVWPFSYG
ncbi:MAG TPA: sulfatase-like hydrolase/transferase [Methylococcus sp.]|nr:sulfatase-like hydrolase/transferase [Methylococcus sp.]